MALVQPATTFASDKTEITKCSLRHVMTVTDTSLKTISTGRWMQSSVFGVINGPRFIVSFYPNGMIEENADYFSFVLHLHAANQQLPTLPQIKFRFSLLDDRSNIAYTNTLKLFCWKPKRVGGFMLCADFMRKRDSGRFMFGNRLDTCCEVVICDDEDELDTSDMEQYYPLTECTLSNDFLSMFHSQQFGDTIIEVDSEEFLVCRKILEARSPVFAAMFEHDMDEQRRGRLAIKDATPRTVKEMLTYIYTGTSPNLQDLAEDLFAIADKYQLERLKSMSERALASNLTKENAIGIMILADLHSVSRLKTFVIDFIVENGFHFLRVPIWENIIRTSLMEYPNLIAEVTCALYSCATLKFMASRKLS